MMTGLSEKINDKSIGEGDIFSSEAGDPFDLICPEHPFLIKSSLIYTEVTYRKVFRYFIFVIFRNGEKSDILGA